METLQSLIDFLDKLEQKKICFRLDKIRDGILVEVCVPGQRWEVEFMYDGTVQIEKFMTQASLYDEQELAVLFRDFSD